MSDYDINFDESIPYKIKSRRETRSLVFHVLYAADRFDYTIDFDDLIDEFRTGFNIEIAPDSDIIRMSKNIIDSRQELDNQIKPLLKNWKIERLGCCTLLILRLAIWELMQKEIPPSIIINEAIELAKGFAEKDAYKFINGILDEYCKINKLYDQDKEKPESSHSCEELEDKEKKGKNDQS
ncbi:transcription antitermination factor NusB [Candidatus Babeliales bacterium]|nr:transcription antitermination factor NusB [Candidatus Babeliales bacterium]MCF7899681.1 transcription antitermination factor NusB [Candidatus Babeliales bacterium]